ncbi:MAG TPA: thioesterase family protein [Marmoricola sp.]|nr:thioesterase family protein [Marmoricola sp.]
MRHTYECPLRWADMDLLGHINNVAYVDYLQEARIEFFADHPELLEGANGVGLVVVRHELDFIAPLKYRKLPVLIDTWVTEVRAGSFVIGHEIYTDELEGRRVYFRAATRLAPMVLATGSPRRISAGERALLEQYLEPAEPRTPLSTEGRSVHVHPLRVRWSDLDTYHHVNNVKYVEFFQEARIAYTRSMHHEGDVFGAFVIARIDIDYKRPVDFRRTAYAVHSWISKVGNSSAVFASELRDGDAVLATTQVVAVGFDTETQRSAPMLPDHRARMVEQFQQATSG